MPALVVTAKEEERVGVPNLERPEVEDTLFETRIVSTENGGRGRGKRTNLDGEVPSVDVVAKEEVAGVGRVSSDFKELHEIKLQVRENGEKTGKSVGGTSASGWKRDGRKERKLTY
jgi:hypothetical protein